MLPSPNDLSMLDSVEVTKPQETQTFLRCNNPGSNVVTFLKRNAFIVLTVAAVALGKCFSNTLYFILLYSLTIVF